MVDSVQIFPPGFRVLDAAGAVVSGARIYFYDAGTESGKAVFSDINLSTTLGAVIYTDSAGYPVTAPGGSTKTLIYTGTDPYKVVIKDASLNTLASHDNVQGAPVGGGGGGGSGITQDAADVRYVRNPNALAAETGIDNTDLWSFWDISAAANKGITHSNAVADIFATAAAAGLSEFAAGTRKPFQQTTPPTGWTKETGAAYNDAALRLVTGTVATGGTAAFATTFASRTPAGSVGATTLVLGDIPAHTHSTAAGSGATNGSGGGSGTFWGGGGVTSSSSGGGTSHTHGFTGTAMDFAVKYADCSIGTKA